MAAPRALQALRSFITRGPCQRGVQLQQIRFHKNPKDRFRLPSEAKQKDKWVPRTTGGLQAAKKKAAAAVVAQPWEVIIAEKATDDVWVECRYPPRHFTLQEAVQQHKELVANPAMMNMPEAHLHLEATLNMATKKKTKMMSNFTNSILLPHKFDAGQNLRVIVFTMTDEDAQRMVEKGAIAAGNVDLISQITAGELTLEDYDFALCHTDMLTNIQNLRKFMKDAFPSKGRGQIGDDLDEMLLLFTDGVTYFSEKPTSDLSKAKINVKLGPLSFSAEQIKENFNAYVNAFNAQRTQAALGQGQFITSAVVTCPPSPEIFALHTEALAPTEVKSKPKPKVKEVKDDLKAMAEVAASVQA